jgi:hypothetical protein
MYFSLPPQNPAKAAEIADQLAVLRAAGYGALLEALADTSNWTKGMNGTRSRPKCSSIARQLGTTAALVKEMFRQAKELLDKANEKKT